MAWLVLLRGVNVGGRSLRTGELVRALPALGLTSFGAAGTFLARTSAPAESVRTAIRTAVPFPTSVVVAPIPELVRTLGAGALDREPRGNGIRRWIAAAERPLDPHPPLPIVAPRSGPWEVRVAAVVGRFALGVRRRLGPRLVYPNDVVERAFGVPTTTRWWEPLESVAGAAARPPAARAAPRRSRGERAARPHSGTARSPGRRAAHRERPADRRAAVGPRGRIM